MYYYEQFSRYKARKDINKEFGFCFPGELVGVLRGLRKFGDQKDIPSLFGRGAENAIVTLVYTEKANGENAKVRFHWWINMASFRG